MLTRLIQEDPTYFILLLTTDLDNHWSETTINHFKATLQITVCLVVIMVQCHTVPAVKAIFTYDSVKRICESEDLLARE